MTPSDVIVLIDKVSFVQHLDEKLKYTWKQKSASNEYLIIMDGLHTISITITPILTKELMAKYIGKSNEYLQQLCDRLNAIEKEIQEFESKISNPEYLASQIDDRGETSLTAFYTKSQIKAQLDAEMAKHKETSQLKCELDIRTYTLPLIDGNFTIGELSVFIMADSEKIDLPEPNVIHTTHHIPIYAGKNNIRIRKTK